MGLAAAELSAAPDPHLVLRKRLREEMEALRGILRKAELMVSSTVDKGGAGAAPRRGKDGRFLADRTPCAKRRKAMPPVEIIEPPPQISKVDRIPCAKKRRTTPPVEPARILEQGEFIEQNSVAISTMDTCGDDATLVVASKDHCSMPRILEDGEMTEEEGVICGDAALVAAAETQKSPSSSSSSGSSSSSDGSSSTGSSCNDSSNSNSSDSDCDDVTSNVAPAILPVPKADACTIAMPAKGLCSPPRILEDGEMMEEEEEVDICGDAGPIAIDKFVESPSSNSSSSNSSGSSSSGSGSSGSSSSDSSASNSSDSDCDDECVTSNPAPADVSKTDTCPMTMPHKVLGPSSLLEDGEIEEEHESSGVSPVPAEKFTETVNRAGSSNGQCVRSSPAPAVRPEPSKPQPAAHCAARHFYAKGFEKKREKVAAAQGRVHHFYAKGLEKKRERDAAAEGTARYLYDNAFEKTHERQRAYEELEEMERKAKAKPIFDWIDPRHLRQLGITTSVEYAVTSERRLPARRGCPLQSILGLFLKAE